MVDERGVESEKEGAVTVIESIERTWKSCWLKVRYPARWAKPLYLGNKKSDSLLRTPDSPVLVHFFNHMWPFFHSTGD